MNMFQTEFQIDAKKRGFHIITDDIILHFSDLKKIRIGILQIYIKHTSASLMINENYDNTVRLDLESHYNELVPENQSYYQHNFEGPDDMPAHIKASLIGSSIHVPITNGNLNLGTWQGIYICEHRNIGEPRKLVATVWGEVQKI